MRAHTSLVVGLLSLSLVACGGHSDSSKKSSSSSAATTTATVNTNTTPGTSGPSPELTIRSGPENPGLVHAQAPTAGVVIGQIRVSANSDVTLTELAITADGTIDESTGLGDCVVYVDSNGNGALDSGESQLGAGQGFGSNNATVTLSGLSQAITPATPLDILIAAELKAAANLSDTVSFRVEGWRARAVDASGAGVAVVGGGISGVLGVIGTDPPKTLTVSKDAQSPAAATGAADASTIPMIVLGFSTTTGQMDLHSLRFLTSGSGDDAADVLEARLGKDANSNGQIDTGEVIARSRPDSDDGALVFNFWGQRLASNGSTYDLIVDYTLAGTAAAGETFALQLKNDAGVFCHTWAGNGGQSITVTQQPIQSATLTVNAASNTLAFRAVGAAARTDAGGSAGVAMTLDAQTGSTAVDVTAVRLSARGTLDDSTGVTGVSLWLDDGDGAFDASSDTQLGTAQTFTSDDGDVTVAIPAGQQTLAAGTTTRVFATATLAAGLPAGESFSLVLEPAGVSASSPVVGERQIGSLIVTGGAASAFAQPDRDLGKDAYLRGEGLYLNDNFGHLGLAVGDRPSGQLGERLIYAEFPLPAGGAPTKAYVALYLTGTGGLTGASLDVEVFRVVPSGLRTPWGEGRGGFDASLDGIVFDGTIQSTFRPDLSQPDVDPTPLADVRIDAGSEGRWVVFDVTAAAQAWYAGTEPNLGLRFRDKNFSAHVDGQVGFASSDSHQARLRPIFLVAR